MPRRPRIHLANLPLHIVQRRHNGDAYFRWRGLSHLSQLAGYSESLFKTMKYRPAYPRKPFTNIIAARQWVIMFVKWYNHEHRHSAIRFVTPAERHAGMDLEILQKRVDVYENAKKLQPNRWSGATRNWQPIRVVHLNPDKHKADKQEKCAT